MKRLIALLGIVVLFGAIAVPVLAHGPGWGRGHHMGHWGGGSGYGKDYGPGPGYGTLTEEQHTQLDKLNKKFYDETTQLRDEIWSKSKELNTALNSPNPDTQKAKGLQKDISDLKAEFAQKRLDFALEERKIVPEARFGKGYGRGHGHMGGYGPGMGGGHHMGGYGPGHCWN